MATIPIRVIQTGNVCRVVPPVNFAKVGADSVQWINRTNDKIIVSVKAGLFDPTPTSLWIDGGSAESKNVLNTAPPNLYPYSVFCYVTNNNAIGNSDPEIIIEP